MLPRSSEDVTEYIGRVHRGIELIEFPDRPERSVLIAAGTGLMLSLMDAVPRLRWCMDADGLSAEQREALPAYLACICNVVD